MVEGNVWGEKASHGESRSTSGDKEGRRGTTEIQAVIRLASNVCQEVKRSQRPRCKTSLLACVLKDCSC